MIVKKYCKFCGKQAVLVNSYKVDTLTFTTYKCGHSSSRSEPKARDFSGLISTDGKHPYQFQKEGIAFGLKSPGRVIIADEMGLGKTLQALGIAEAQDLRVLIICKAGLRIQWVREHLRWRNNKLAQILEGEKEFVLPQCDGYVMSYDILWRFKDIPAFIKKLNVDMIILDEIQNIMNSNSKRTNGVRIAIQEVEYAAGLSGTPIKNNALEWFPVLNMFYPDRFPKRDRFEMQFIDMYWNGHTNKPGGIKNYEAFKAITSDFIIRRTKDDVMPDMPKVSRNFLFTDMSDSELENQYKALVREFQDLYSDTDIDDAIKSANLLAYMTKMRHIVGRTKIEAVFDYTQDFMSETDRKLLIFVHHKDVTQVLQAKLNAVGIKSVQLRAGQTTQERQDAIDTFRYNSTIRVCIASTLASGEGVDGLQYACSDGVLMEREWNPANESQAEARLDRIGQTRPVEIMYPCAVGTMDEFFSEIVEKKRTYVDSALDGKESKWQESSIMKELAEIIAQKGGQKWGF
jgi:SWI/SNF-related matrix-associated actin-dependent regulator 1 of chromatin subfamily A